MTNDETQDNYYPAGEDRGLDGGSWRLQKNWVNINIILQSYVQFRKPFDKSKSNFPTTTIYFAGT